MSTVRPESKTRVASVSFDVGGKGIYIALDGIYRDVEKTLQATTNVVNFDYDGDGELVGIEILHG